MSRELLIAVIDDDHSFRMSLIESLHSLGHRARGYASAEDFLADQPKGSDDYIITDIHMPGMSGLELKRLLAERGSTTPVIMITARVDPVLEAKVLASGAACMLRKPFETDALVAFFRESFNS